MRNVVSSLVPIAFFAYKRPGHTLRALRALAACKGATSSPLVIFSDAPKTEKDVEGVQAVRDIIAQAAGFASVELVCRTANLGAAGSIIDGVTQMLKRYERAIFIEDDLICSPHTLTYFNDCLDRFADEPAVMAACAYNYPCGRHQDFHDYKFDTYYSAGFFPWGWATWQRTLKHIDWKARDYEKFLSDPHAVRAFGRIDGDLPNLLRRQQKGELDDWVLPFTLSQFKRNAVTVCPIHSHIDSIGHDGSGLHCKDTELFHVDLRLAQAKHSFPDFIYIDEEISRHHRLFHSKSLKYRVRRRLVDQLLKFVRRSKPTGYNHFPVPPLGATHSGGL